MLLSKTIALTLSFASLIGVLSQGSASNACSNESFVLNQPVRCFDSNGAIGSASLFVERGTTGVSAQLERKSNEVGSGARARGLPRTANNVLCISDLDTVVDGRPKGSDPCVGTVARIRVDAF